MPIQHSQRDILLHIILIVVFLFSAFLFSSSKPFEFNNFTIANFISYLLTIVFFYFNYLYLIPKLYDRKKYFEWVAICLICLIIIITVPYFLFTKKSVIEQGAFLYKDFVYFAYNDFLRFVIALFISLFLFVQQKFKQVQKDKLETELTYLKSQINPHFLFNSINTIYSLTLEKSNQAPNAVLKLSGLMRYVIDDVRNQTVSLGDEIKYIKDYISLQQLRSPKNVIINFDVFGDTSNLTIAPLILINYLENAFKFGINPEENSNIEIRIDIIRNNLNFKIKNNKVFTRNSSKKGIGLDNTKKRLNHLYPNRYKLDIIDNDNIFEINLNIDL